MMVNNSTNNNKNEQLPPLILNYIKMTTTHGVGNQGPGYGQAQNVAGQTS